MGSGSRAQLALSLALAMWSGPAVAQAPEPGPWDPAVEAAAEAAVARLGGKRALDVRPVVRDIPGLRGGGTRGIVATVQEVRQAMRDLGAEETDLEVRVELPADVLFDFDKAEIRPDAAQALAQLATIVRAYPEGGAQLEGHTDSKGNDAYNQRLSERRAEAVRAWLIERERIDAARLTASGRGETRPVADNDTEEGRQRNRRVDVVVRKR